MEDYANTITNPWIGSIIGQKVIKLFRDKYNEETVSSNFVFIISLPPISIL